MNAILSIKPQFVEEIVAGKKKFEYRKSVFKQPVEKVYVYASAPISKVIGEFQPVDVVSGVPADVWKETKKFSGITKKFFDEYYKGRKTAYAIVIVTRDKVMRHNDENGILIMSLEEFLMDEGALER